jgi:hypothetical protein
MRTALASRTRNVTRNGTTGHVGRFHNRHATVVEMRGIVDRLRAKESNMTDESVLEWAKGWLRENAPEDPTFQQRFLDGLEEELNARGGAIHLLCDAILSSADSWPALVALAKDARNLVQPAETS